MKLDILGTEYEISEHSKAEDLMLEECDGYCDKTSKRIVITIKEKDCAMKSYMHFCLNQGFMKTLNINSGDMMKP